MKEDFYRVTAFEPAPVGVRRLFQMVTTCKLLQTIGGGRSRHLFLVISYVSDSAVLWLTRSGCFGVICE